LLNERHGQGSPAGIIDLWAYMDARRALEQLNVFQRIDLKAIV